MLQGFVLREFTNKLSDLLVTCACKAFLFDPKALHFADIYLLMCIGEGFFSYLMRNIFKKFEKIHATRKQKKQGIRVKSNRGKQLTEGKVHLGQKRIDESSNNSN